MMRRKRRHPHQILDACGLAVGARYAFVSAYPPRTGETVDSIHTCVRVMGGVVPNTVAQAERRGWDLTTFRDKSSRGGFSEKIPLYALLDIDSPPTDAEIVTVHPDGWGEEGDKGADPTLTYWAASADGGTILWRGWDRVGSYFGYPKPCIGDHHLIVVPEDRWRADPKLYAVDWREPELHDASPADFDRIMRRKRDEAMLKYLW